MQMQDHVAERVYDRTPRPRNSGRLRFAPALVSTGLLVMAALGSVPGRVVAATLIVNSKGDLPDLAPGVGGCNTGNSIVIGQVSQRECTLRAAIEEANALSGLDVIVFHAEIPVVSNQILIQPTTPLPTLTDSLTIDGYSAPSYDLAAPDAVPVVQVSGVSLTLGASGIFVDGAPAFVIRGLALHGFPGRGIHVLGDATTSTIEGCHVGVSRGLLSEGNGMEGIVVVDGQTTIGKTCTGSTCVGKGNLIASNSLDGVFILNATATIAGNRIGTDRLGSSTFVPFGGPTSNGGYGVRAWSTSGGIAIGIPTQDESGENLISGNIAGGVYLLGAGNTLRANKIGTNALGTAALPNEGPGVESWNTEGEPLVLGSTEPGAGNLISGNLGGGIVDELGRSTIAGNTIGLTVPPHGPLPNTGIAIQLKGDATIVEDNLIAGIDTDGLQVLGSSNQIRGNRIGTDGAGANLGGGVIAISVEGDSNTIGWVQAGNVVGFTASDAIRLSETADDNLMVGNFIGVDPAGNAIPIGDDGIEIRGSFNRVGLSSNSLPLVANRIGNAADDGIDLLATSTENRILSNYVGTNENGDDHGVADNGIEVGGVGNVVGALPDEEIPGFFEATTLNVIAYSGRAAVQVDGDGTTTGLAASLRGNRLFSNTWVPAIDLEGDGPTPNDPLDRDVGVNNRQNWPEFEAEQTFFDQMNGTLEVAFRVDSEPIASTYPLVVDFYIRASVEEEVGAYIGSDSIPLESAGDLRMASITAPDEVEVAGALVAIATDANGNSSEVSVQAVYVPEPEPGLLAVAGAVLFLFWMRTRGGQIRQS